MAGVETPYRSVSSRRAHSVAGAVEVISWLCMICCVVLGVALAVQTRVNGFTFKKEHPFVAFGIGVGLAGAFQALFVIMIAAYIQAKTDEPMVQPQSQTPRTRTRAELEAMAPAPKPPESLAPRDLAIRSAVLREIREAAVADQESAALRAVIDRFAQTVWPQRPITEWFFASASGFVARYDGALYVCTVKDIRGQDTSAGLPTKYMVDGSENIVRVDLGGESFTAVRPHEPAIRLLHSMHATRYVVDQQSTVGSSLG